MAESPAPLVDIDRSIVHLDPRVHPPRVSAVPRSARGDRFEAEVEPTLLIADILREASGRRILILLGAAFRTMNPDTDIEVRCGETGRALATTYLTRDTLRAPKWLVVDAPDSVTTLDLAIGGQRILRPVQPNLSHLFAGRRTLFMVSRNEPLQRIVDWVWWHVDRHRFDGVVYYHNGSRDYDWRDAAEALTDIPGLRSCVVVDWTHVAYPFARGKPWGLSEAWSQNGGYWHALQRFLQEAELVFNGDVDELIVSFNGTSLDHLLEDDTWDAILPPAQDVVTEHGVLPPDARHRDLFLLTAAPDFRHQKWLVRCSGAPPEHFPSMHVPPMYRHHQLEEDQLRLVHFRPLTTGWHGRQLRRIRTGDNPEFAEDSLNLRRQLEDVFDRWSWPPRAPSATAPPGMPGTMPDGART
jgi:hypothetical protein